MANLIFQQNPLFEVNEVKPLEVGGSKLLKTWSGRRDSNPRRPAWEVIRHSNLNHLESAGVGLESTETPGKTAVNRERPLNGVQLECRSAKTPASARYASEQI